MNIGDYFFCPNCMRLLPEEEVCPVCGFDPANENPEDVLPRDALLYGGRYRLGAYQEHDDDYIRYIAYDLVREKPVELYEFFPSGCERNEDWEIMPAEGFHEDYEKLRDAFVKKVKAANRKSSRFLCDFEENHTAYVICVFQPQDNKKTIFHYKSTVVVVALFLFLLCCWGIDTHIVQKQKCGNKLMWKIEENVLILTGSGTMDDFDCAEDTPWYGKRIDRISFIGEPVSIGTHAFDGCRYITGVDLPDSILSIGEYAFASCTSLEYVTLPAHLFSLPEGCFWGCTRLHDINLQNITNIPCSCFENCYQLSMPPQKRIS